MKLIMTKQVLLFGALAMVLLLSMWSLLIIVPSLRLLAEFSSRPGDTLFSLLGPAFWFWIGLLTIALVLDYGVSHRDQNAVRPFAAVLKSDVLPQFGSATQTSEGNLLLTRTSGTLGTRTVSVTMRHVAG